MFSSIVDRTSIRERNRSTPGARNRPLSKAEFLRLYDYELLRSDRSNSPLSLIILHFEDSKQIRKHLSSLRKSISQRIRQLDDWGLLASDKVGILAPYTDEEGAKSLSKEIGRSLSSTNCRPRFEQFENSRILSSAQTSSNRSPKSNQERTSYFQLSDDLAVQSTPAWKRTMDVVGAAVLLVLLSPLFLLIAILVKATSKGPVFFCQRRTGRGGRPFWMFKFRSMIPDAEAQRQSLMHLNQQDGPAFKITDDPRITVVGHWLRSLSLDELPQLINVFLGNMSFVGPRPLPCEEAAQCNAWQRRRLLVTPGITCIWQVKDRSTPIAFVDWMRMDLRYANSITLKHDVIILLRTAGFLIGRRNV